VQPIDLLFKLGDARSRLAASERLSVCFRAVTSRPSWRCHGWGVPKAAVGNDLS
jgi:hypothetical protein